jgi:hypothetical protein
LIRRGKYQVEVVGIEIREEADEIDEDDDNDDEEGVG